MILAMRVEGNWLFNTGLPNSGMTKLFDLKISEHKNQ